MTKEDCVTKVNEEWKDGIYPGMANDKMFRAMDMFAKQQVINFSEWVTKKGYIKAIGKNAKWFQYQNEGKKFTTEQLYKQYLLQSKQ